MWERTFLRDLAVVLAASFPVLFICRRLKVPQVVGFLLTGVAIGPHALGWVREASRVESIAEFGVALILLFVGLEFPIRRLKALGRTSLVAGRVVLAIAGVAALIAVARRAAPRLLDAVARMGSRETFTGAVVVLVLAMVAAGEKAGVSAAMGAFAAGIVLGESDHVHEVAATLAPLHDLLSSLFFVSVGMLLEPAFLASHPVEVGAGVVVLVAVKAVAAFAALRVAGTVPRTAARAALALANVGEFSFVLATTGASLALLTGEARQILVAATVGTLVLAPFLVAAGPTLAVRLAEAVEDPGEKAETPRARHIVIVGAGLNGTNVARVLHETGIPHVLVDIDPDRVAAARQEGLEALRADATGLEGLRAAGVARALGVAPTRSSRRSSRPRSSSSRACSASSTCRAMSSRRRSASCATRRTVTCATRSRRPRPDAACQPSSRPGRASSSSSCPTPWQMAGCSRSWISPPRTSPCPPSSATASPWRRHPRTSASPPATRSSSSAPTRTSRASCRGSRRWPRRPRLRVDSASERAHIVLCLGVAREGLRSHPGT
jgi:Kef-type K+ transport system membrane component KefB